MRGSSALVRVLGAGGVAILAGGFYLGFAVVPADSVQGEVQRIMYLPGISPSW
jgi:ABC-type transport system involved in cytochrome c biogenesis permease subunit